MRKNIKPKGLGEKTASRSTQVICFQRRDLRRRDRGRQSAWKHKKEKNLLLQTCRKEHEEKYKSERLPPPPINLHEYQKKRLTELAFRKGLILKAMFMAVREELRAEKAAPRKEKRQPSCRTPNRDLYKLKCTKGSGGDKENSALITHIRL